MMLYTCVSCETLCICSVCRHGLSAWCQSSDLSSIECEPGKFSDIEGATECKPCPQEYPHSATGAAECCKTEDDVEEHEDDEPTAICGRDTSMFDGPIPGTSFLLTWAWGCFAVCLPWGFYEILVCCGVTPEDASLAKNLLELFEDSG